MVQAQPFTDLGLTIPAFDKLPDDVVPGLSYRANSRTAEDTLVFNLKQVRNSLHDQKHVWWRILNRRFHPACGRIAHTATLRANRFLAS